MVGSVVIGNAWCVYGHSVLEAHSDEKVRQGCPARPGAISRPRSIQARTFPQRGRNLPRRPRDHTGVWRREADMPGAALCRRDALRRDGVRFVRF